MGMGLHSLRSQLGELFSSIMIRIIEDGRKSLAFWGRTMKSARGTHSFLIGGVVVVLLTIPYSFYLSALSRNEAKDFLYLSTGINYRLDESLPNFLVPIIIFATFQMVALLTYSILRVGTSTILAVAGTIIFITSAQFALVFMSAPLWDMVTFVPLLAGVLAALLLVLIPTWSVLPQAEIFYGIRSRIFVAAMIIIVVLLSHQNFRSIKWMLTGTPMGPNGTQIFVIQSLAFGLLVLSIVVLVVRHRVIHTLAFRQETVTLVVIVSVMCAIFMSVPWITGARSYQGPSALLLLVLVLAPIFSPIRRQLKLRAALSLVLLIVLEVSTNVVSNLFWGASKFMFYMSSGWQSSSQLVAGLDDSSVLMGVPFTDAGIFLFVEQQGLSSLAFLSILGPMFMLVNLNYLFIGIHYLLGGTWLYPEPPVGAVGILWDARMFAVDSIGTLSTVFGVFAVLLLLRFHRRAGLFLLSLILVILALIALSRPQMHQWWFVPIFGVWSMIYCVHLAFSWVRGIRSSPTFSVNLGAHTFSTEMGKWAIFFRTFLAVSVTSISILLIAAVSDFAEPKISTTVSNKQSQAQSDSLAGYSGLPWKTVDQSKLLSDDGPQTPPHVLAEIPKDASLIRVIVVGSCSLSGSKFTLQHVDVFDTVYATHYFVGESPSKVAYLPVIEPTESGEERISSLLLQGGSPVCQPSVATAPVLVGEEPIVGWLPTSCRSEQADESVCPPQLEEGGATQQLFSPFNFEGYLTPEVPMPTRNAFGQEVPHDASGQETSSISAKVLGRGGHGYMVKDIWVSEWRSTTEQDSLRVSGKVHRGTSIIGVEFYPPNGISQPIPLVEYAVEGSIFNRGGSLVGECFVIPAGSRYRVFIGGATDLYSPSWNKIDIEEIGIGIPCGELSNSEQWIPTFG